MKVLSINNINVKVLPSVQLKQKNYENKSTSETIKMSYLPINFRGQEKVSQGLEYNYSEKELMEMSSPEKYTKWNLLSTEAPSYKSLEEGDKKALEHLVKAADCFDSVFKRMDNVHNLDFEKKISTRCCKG